MRSKLPLVLLIGLAVLTCCLALSPASSKTQPRKPSATPTPTPAPSPPVIEFQAIPDRDVVERDQDVTVVVIIANKSATPVTLLDVTGSGGAFTVTPLQINSELGPFATITDTLAIKPISSAPFITQKLALITRYTWGAGGSQVKSAQSATVSITVRRRFDEEAKGFPGGTAAFLYLLLPILPALLSYQLIDRWRKGEGWQLPSFGPNHIVPAFFLAIVLSFVILWAAKSESGINYSEPLVFLGVLTLSLLAGAIVPVARSMWDRWQRLTWGFKNNEPAASYVRKALLAPWSPAEFIWATGRVERMTWKGILLTQPGGAKVLGATLQVSHTAKLTPAAWATVRAELFDVNGQLLDRGRLVALIEAGDLSVEAIEPVMEGSRALASVVAATQIKGFQQTNSEVKNLLTPVT